VGHSGRDLDRTQKVGVAAALSYTGSGRKNKFMPEPAVHRAISQTESISYGTIFLQALLSASSLK
jgi:hypothetical protein